MDVVILGGGCAGTATALSLLKHDPSLRVAVVEASNYTEARIGEVLSPHARPLLKHLGVWDAFLVDGHAQAHGTSAVWGDDESYDNEFIFSPHGEGWRLDRARFDSMLARQAEAAGCDLHTGSRVVAEERRSGAWRLEVRRGGEKFQLDARFVVDATGRRGAFARRRGVGKITFDQLLGAYVFFAPATGAAEEGFTLVEAWEEGWWYAAKLPNGSLAVACMSDVDRVKALGLRNIGPWLERLASTSRVRRLVESAQPLGQPSCHPAGTQRLEQAVGEGWLAVGDAASTFDPLSSHGMFKGLRFGVLAAYAVCDHLGGDRGALEKYQAQAWGDFESYLETRTEYYRLEQRWPDSPFWRRRFGDVTLDPRQPLCVATNARSGFGSMHLPASELERLRGLCKTPRAAHEVVAEYQQQRRGPLSDHRIVLALQHLLAQGVLTCPSNS